jgi:hypothetical protein
MAPLIAQVVFVTSPKALSEPQLPTIWLVCGALGRVSTRLTCATWCCWAKDRIQEKTSNATSSTCASEWNIFLFVFVSTPCFEILLLLLFWRGWCFTFFSFYMLCDWSTFFLPLLFEHILFSMTPLSFCKNTRKEISLELWSIYFWWMDGMFCVTLGVGVSLYM